MPRDSWSKANAREKYGPLPYKQSCRNKRVFDSGGARRQSKASRKARKAMQDDPALVSKRFSSNSVIWFGKHKNKPIADVPIDYLEWLVRQRFTDYRMIGLAMFIKEHLLRVTNGSLTRINRELDCLASV